MTYVKVRYTNIRPLADGLPLGTAKEVTLDVIEGRGTYAALFTYLVRKGWDINGVEYDHQVARHPIVRGQR